MNGRSWLVTFFLFLFLVVMIVLQLLSMVQSDRLYERLNLLLDRLQSSRPVRMVREETESADLPMEGGPEEYPGDEGDWLVWCINAEPATLNAVTAKDVYASWIVGSYYWSNVVESLLDYDFDEVVLKPLLAKRYEVSEDGLEITIELKENIWFSDGVPVTADDVIFTYKTTINPKVDAHELANYYRDIKEVVKIDERTVKFIMSQPYFKSLEVVGTMGILPKHIYEFDDPHEFNMRYSDPVGSGPYVFERWDVGREIVLRRNEHYWGKKPKLKRIIFKPIANPVASLQAIRSHEVDFTRPTSEQFAELSIDELFLEGFDCLSYWEPLTGYAYIGWNYDTPYFSDRRVRLAMTHLVDREGIVQHLLKGIGKVVTGPFYTLGPQNNPDIQPWPYDPERAKELLDEAGWIDTNGDGIRDKDGVPFRFKFMITSGGGFPEKLAKLLKDEAAKAGIDVIVDPYEWSVFEERLNTRSFEAVTLMWGGVVESDPYQIWHSSQVEGRGSNRIGFVHPEADTLIEEARKTLDLDKRNKLYHRFHEILHHEQPYTFLITRPSLRLIDKRFKNVRVHKIGLNPHEWHVSKEKQRYK